MQIKHISDCCKPRSKTIFLGTARLEDSKKKVLYKHFHQMSDEDLRSYSMLKAYNKVQDSTKMKIKRVLPAITTLAIGTSIALAQPGKFSGKVKSGLGFLVLCGLFDAVTGFALKHVDNYYKNKKSDGDSDTKKQTLAKYGVIAATTALFIGAQALASARKSSLPKLKLFKFLSKEKATLANELDNLKIGKFIEKHTNNFAQKHKKLSAVLSATTPLAIFGTFLGVNHELKKSISKDMCKFSLDNYIKGKAAQIDARKHFDSIDAIEV